MRHFLKVLSEMFMKMPRHGSVLEKLQVLVKSMHFVVSHELSHFFQPFSERFIETPKHGSLLEKVA